MMWIVFLDNLIIKVGLLLVLVIGVGLGFLLNFLIVICLLIFIIVLYSLVIWWIDKLKMWGWVWLLIFKILWNFFVIIDVEGFFFCLSKVLVVIVVFMWIDFMVLRFRGVFLGMGWLLDIFKIWWMYFVGVLGYLLGFCERILIISVWFDLGIYV